MNEEIKAIIFDVGGVLYLGKQKSHEHIYESLNLPEEKYFGLVRNTWENLVSGKVRNQKGIKEMSKALKISKSSLKKLWIESIKERFVLNEPLLKIVKSLKRNYKTAILSDQWFIPYKILINSKIKGGFDVLVFSHKEKVRKPEQKIYLKTLKKLRLKPEQCIFIDDLDKNLVPAKKLGMKTILFKSNKQLIKDLDKLNIKK